MLVGDGGVTIASGFGSYADSGDNATIEVTLAEDLFYHVPEDVDDIRCDSQTSRCTKPTMMSSKLLHVYAIFPLTLQGVRLQEREAAAIRGAASAQAGLHEDPGQPREDSHQGKVPHGSTRGNVSTRSTLINQ